MKKLAILMVIFAICSPAYARVIDSNQDEEYAISWSAIEEYYKRADKEWRDIDRNLSMRIKERLNEQGYYANTDSDKPENVIERKASWATDSPKVAIGKIAGSDKTEYILEEDELTNPTIEVTPTKYEEKLDKIEIYIDGKVVATQKNIASGTKYTLTYYGIIDKTTTISAVVYDTKYSAESKKTITFTEKED